MKRIRKGCLIRAFLLPLCFLVLLSSAAPAGEPEGSAERKLRIIPLASFEHIAIGERSMDSPGIGLVLAADESAFVARYARHAFGDELPGGYPDGFHSVELMHAGKSGRHDWLAVFKSESDQPVSGGLDTFQSAAVYGHEWFRGERLSFFAGGGLALGDFGLELPNGRPLAVIPVPYVKFDYGTDWLSASFSFMTGPALAFTVAPESRVRFTGDVCIEQFRDVRDVIFDGSLHYRFFGKTHRMGDIAGISAGIKNDVSGFTSGKLNESYEMSYYALFGKLDLSLVQITGGYAFGGRERFGSTPSRVPGDGLFFSLEAMYPF